MEVITLTITRVLRIFCCNLRGNSSLHVLGLLLSVSGIFRFWLNFEPLLSLCLLLFNWILCILLECVAVEILFQIPWFYLKLRNVTLRRCFVFAVIFCMGLINVYSMWQLCLAVHDCVSSHSKYSWMIITPPLWLAMFTAMSHAIVLAICIPVQVIVIPLECNKDIPNIIFRNHVTVTLVVNFWLFIHFVYLNVGYSHYNVVTLFYRLCCTLWMIPYCYPHCFKRRLPNWIRKLLRPIRMTRVWRDVKAVIKKRRKVGNMVDIQTNLLNMSRSLWYIINCLWSKLYRNSKCWLPIVMSCILITCLLKYHIDQDFTSVLFIVTALSIHSILLFYQLFCHCFRCFVCANCSCVPVQEEFEMKSTVPIDCTDK